MSDKDFIKHGNSYGKKSYKKSIFVLFYLE